MTTPLSATSGIEKENRKKEDDIFARTNSDSSEDLYSICSGAKSLASGTFSIDESKNDLGSNSSLLDLASVEPDDTFRDRRSFDLIDDIDIERKDELTELIETSRDIHLDHMHKNEDFSYPILIESVQKLQNTVRTTRKTLNTQIYSKNALSLHSMNKNTTMKRYSDMSNARNRFSGHSGGASVLLELFEELTDMILSCIEKSDDRFEQTSILGNAHETVSDFFRPLLQLIPKLSVVFGDLRNDVILNNEYYHSMDQETIDVDLVLSRFVSILEFMIDLISSLSNYNQSQYIYTKEYTPPQSRTPILEVIIFKILITVLGEGVHLIKEINERIVNISSTKTILDELYDENDCTMELELQVNKEDTLIMNERAMLAAIGLRKKSFKIPENNSSYDQQQHHHHHHQHMHRQNEGAIFRTHLPPAQVDNLTSSSVPLISLNEIAVLWERLAGWCQNIEDFLSINMPTSTSVSISDVWAKDIKELNNLSQGKMEDASKPFESTTSILATIARNRKSLQVAAELSNEEHSTSINNESQTKVWEKPPWNQIDFDENKIVGHSKFVELKDFSLSEQEFMVSAAVSLLTFLYDFLYVFRRSEVSFTGCSVCLIAATSYGFKKYIDVSQKISKVDYLYKTSFTPYDLLLSFNKNANPNENDHILQRKELQETISSTIIKQLQQKKVRNKETNMTVLTGPPGCGSTTLATLVIQNNAISKAFDHGIAWLALGPYPLTYKALIELYDQICKKFTVNQPDLYCDVHQYYVSPENNHDERDLMINLRQEMIDWFHNEKKESLSKSLIVLDGLRNMEDLQWFQFDDDMRSSGPLLLITLNTGDKRFFTVNDEILADADIVPITPLSNEEVLTLLSKYSSKSDRHDETQTRMSLALHWDSYMKKVTVKQFRSLPFYINLIGRMSKMKSKLDRDWNCLDERWWKAIFENIQSQSESSYALKEDLSKGDQTSFIVNLLFSPLCIESDGLATILKLCFSSFMVVFFESSCFLNEHPNYSPNSLFIPWTTTCLLWNAILDSKEVSDQQIISLEQYFFRYQQHSKENEIVSRASFIRHELECLGLIKSIYYKSEDGETLLRGVVIPNESLIFSAESLLVQDSTPDETLDDGFERKEREWNLLLVQAYEAKMKKYGFNLETLSTVGIDLIDKDELRYLFQFLPHHLIVAGMSSTAGKMLAGCGFVRNRLTHMGILNGTKQHIKDAEFLLEVTQKDMHINDSSKKDWSLQIEFASAKSAVVISYEQLADYLVNDFNSLDIDVDFDFRDLLLFALGSSIQRQGWHNEAFVFFQEAIIISRNDFEFDESSNCLRQLLSRTHYAVGLVCLENDNTMEAITNFTEAIVFYKTTNGTLQLTRHAADMFYNLGRALFVRGDFEVALDTFSRALHLHIVIDSESNLEKANITFHIGKINRELGNLDGAVTNYSKSLHLKRTALGPNDVDIAKTLHELGEVCHEQGDTIDAIRLYSEATDIWKNAYLKESSYGIDYSNSLHNLGVVCRQNGDLDEAMKAYQNALQLRKSILGSFHIDVAQTYHNIGILHCENGKYDDAMKAYAKALRVREELLGRNSADFSNTLHNIGVVIRQRGDTDEARQVFMEALWIAKSLDIDPPSIDAMRERCAILFGANILNQPCVSSRVFACASLMVDVMLEKESLLEDNDVASKQSPSTFMECVRPILPILTAFVDAELAVMNSDGNRLKMNGVIGEIPRTTSVKFCSFDFSSVSTPVDMRIGSNQHLERCINALEKILQEINDLCADENEMQSLKKNRGKSKLRDGDNVITKMLLVFHVMAAPVDGTGLRKVCSEIMPNEGSDKWPSSRFMRAAQLYKDEFEAIVALLESKREGTSVSKTLIFSPLRRKLCSYISSAIRFHLRRLLDPPPLCFTLPSESYQPPDFSACRAKTHELVWMASPEEPGSASSSDGEGSKLSESPISYVLNVALCRIYAYFKALPDIIKVTTIKKRNTSIENSKSNRSSKRNDVDDFFGLSSSSIKCLDEETRDLPIMDDDDAQNILEDIRLIEIALSASRAAHYILSLLHWPGVKGAIEEAGGWSDSIELFVNIICRHHLHRDCPEDAHLTLLRNVKEFQTKLEREQARMVRVGSVSQRILYLMWKRFKRGSRKTWQNTNENTIRQALVDGSSYLMFPHLVTPNLDA